MLKHAANVTGCALAIERAFSAAGFPPGAFATLLVPSGEMEAIVADPRVAAVTLTGSEAAGSSVAATAGRHLKKTVLELGGSDAFVVLADADVAAAAQVATKARFQNAGQSCIAAKRFIVEDAVHDAFVAAFVGVRREACASATRSSRATQVGPLAREDLRGGARRAGARIGRARRATSRSAARAVDAAGLLLRADRADRRRRRDAGLPRGDVRAGRRRRARARRRRTRSRSPTTPSSGSGGNLWTRDLARATHARRRPRVGQRVHQRHDRVRPAAAVRRRQDAAATAASCPRSGSASSSTSRRSGSARRPTRRARECRPSSARPLVLSVRAIIGITLACSVLSACATEPPVTASRCTVARGSGRVIVAGATITNESSKPVQYVEVIITTAGLHGLGAVTGYDFNDRLEPGETKVLTTHAPPGDQDFDQYFGNVTGCLPHQVRYLDGSVWEGPAPSL